MADQSHQDQPSQPARKKCRQKVRRQFAKNGVLKSSLPGYFTRPKFKGFVSGTSSGRPTTFERPVPGTTFERPVFGTTFEGPVLGTTFQGATMSSDDRGFFKQPVVSVFGRQPPSVGKLKVEPSDSWRSVQPPTSYGGSSQNIRGPGNATDVKPHGPFPELVVFYGGAEKRAHLFLRKSFTESPYGRLEKTIGRNGSSVKVILSCKGIDLAEGVSNSKIEAEEMAVVKLLKNLRKTNYFIEAKSSYFSKNKVPSCVLNVDPALSHIFKVVCLKKPRWPKFPHSLAGAVEYVASEDELWKYIDEHCEREPKVELFVLNIEKSQRKIVKPIANKYGMKIRFLNGCSDRGVVVYREENVYSILEELLKCGGDNVKYHLYPPGSDFADIHLGDDDGDGGGRSGDEEEDSDGEVEVQQQNIPQDPWIADNLVLMDIYTHMSKLAEPKEMLFCNVRDCPQVHRFIIQKKQDKVSRMITAEALIDMKPVGRAKAYTEKKSKILAAKNALSNLMDYCYYIRGKESYFGVKGNVPQFLSRKVPGFESNIYCIPRLEDLSSKKSIENLFKQFMAKQTQDLFITENVPMQLRRMAYQVAKKMDLTVRLFGNYCLCVFKRLRPKMVLKELLATRGHENEKYMLIMPPSREFDRKPEMNPQSNWNKGRTFQPNPNTSQPKGNIVGLFDFENKNHVTPFEKMEQELSQKRLQSNERPQNSNGPFRNWEQSASARSTADRGTEPFYSEGNKRSYEPDVGAGHDDKRFRSSASAWSSRQQTGNREDNIPDVRNLFDVGEGFTKDLGNKSHQQMQVPLNLDYKRSPQFPTPSNYDGEQRSISNLFDLGKGSHDETRDGSYLAQSKKEHIGNVSKLFDLDRPTRELNPRIEESANRNRQHEQDVFLRETELDFPHGKESPQRFESSNLRDSRMQLKESWNADRRPGDWSEREPNNSESFDRSMDFGDNNPRMEEQWNKDQRTSFGQAQDDSKEREPSLYEKSREWIASSNHARESLSKDRSIYHSPDRRGTNRERINFLKPSYEEDSNKGKERGSGVTSSFEGGTVYRDHVQLEEELYEERRRMLNEQDPGIIREREPSNFSSFHKSEDDRNDLQVSGRGGYNQPMRNIEEQLYEEGQSRWRTNELGLRDEFDRRGNSREEPSNRIAQHRNEEHIREHQDRREIRDRDLQHTRNLPSDVFERIDTELDPTVSYSRTEQSLNRERSYESDRLKHRESDFSRLFDKRRGSESIETSRRREDDRNRGNNGRYRDLEPSARGIVETRPAFSQSLSRGSELSREKEQLWTKENKLLYKYDHARIENRHRSCQDGKQTSFMR